MGVGTNQQRSTKSVLLHRHTESTNSEQRSTTEYSDRRASPRSSLARQPAERERSERQSLGRDANYGLHKVSPPLFYEVGLSFNISKVANRLRHFGRAFPRDGEIVQVAHVLRKRGRHYICHFKSLLYLDDVIRREDITMRDLAETLAAVDMLKKSGMVTPLFGDDWRADSFGPIPSHVRDVSADRDINWRLVSKYTFKPQIKDQNV